MPIEQIRRIAAPAKLAHAPRPPRYLYAIGADLDGLMAKPRIAIVGSRKVSAYGREITARLASDLARSGIVIISGLAYGVDAIAQRAALEAGGQVIAVLAGGLDKIYPLANIGLARRIVAGQGVLLSEYPVGIPAAPFRFIERNRLVAGLADRLLVTEAGQRSGTSSTVGFALEQDIPVLAVPGNITQPNAAGPNKLIYEGAQPILEANDVLIHLGHTHYLKAEPAVPGDPILQAIAKGIRSTAELLQASGLEIADFNQRLTLLELAGRIRSSGGEQWSMP